MTMPVVPRIKFENISVLNSNPDQDQPSINQRKVKTSNLSPRESEILALLAEGLTDKEIVCKLSSSFTTVRTHLNRIYEKMQVRCRTEASVKYIRWCHEITQSSQKF